MGVGLPVVSTRLAGIPEMVAEGETGLLVGEREPEVLAGALKTLLLDPELARRMGARGKSAAGRFAVQTTAAELRALLENR
jgi:glycosyltransferase involved in cell wall biosynthesis